MSRHHRAQKWSTHAPKLRATLAAQLPLPCVECGRPVLPEQQWQVGHRIPASQGGRPTAANTGAVHTSCNKRAGGALGARTVNARRAPKRPPSEMSW
jgi:5-methylcytosine-specific restriction endonuclease McrA